MPFGFPNLKASDVELEGSFVRSQDDAFHHQLIQEHRGVAGVARFPGARATPDPSDALVWQAPVPDLTLDGEAERFLVHCGPAGGAGKEHTPNSPGSQRPRTSTRKAGVQAPRSVPRKTAVRGAG